MLERLFAPPFARGGPVGQAKRRGGLQRMLDWLASRPGGTWQEQWMASGADAAGNSAWRGLALAWIRDRGIGFADESYLHLGGALRILICGDVIRPTLSWLTTPGSVRFLAADMARVRDPAAFARLTVLIESGTEQAMAGVNPPARPDGPPGRQRAPRHALADQRKKAMTAQALPAALRACADGIYALEPSVELLIAHACWLDREDFARFIRTATTITDGTTELALIDWAAAITALNAGELPCSSGEHKVLQLAASLADHIPVSLGATITGLDDRNVQLLLTAVLHACGQRQSPLAP